MVLDAKIVTAPEAGRVIAYLVERLRIGTLNIAGPRQSEWEGGYDYACAALENFLRATFHKGGTG